MNYYKTIFISDLHLLSTGCNSELLIDFLDNNKCDRFILVGDVLDGWRARSSLTRLIGIGRHKYGVFLDSTQVRVLKKILSKIATIRTDYIIGNHDDFLDTFQDDIKRFGNLHISRELTYTTVKGKKFIVFHGDKFDGITRYHEWLAFLADYSYNMIIYISHWIQTIRKWIGYKSYWSLSYIVKHKVKQGVEAIMNYKESIIQYCKINRYDGAICGHSHFAEQTKIDGIEYYNCGDWVDSCTAVVETHEGELKLIYWKR